MAPYDLLVKSSTIITPAGRVSGQIAVRGETIAGILAADDDAVAKKTIDAGDKPVIPGLIDTHCHSVSYTHLTLPTNREV